jgi:hypothetical protein
METKKSVRHGIIKLAIATILACLYLFLYLWGEAKKPVPIDVTIMLALMCGLPSLLVLGLAIKNYRSPKLEDYSSTFKIDGDFLIVKNCSDEKRILISKIKFIELSGRRFVARLKGIGLDFGTTFDSADKEQLRATVEQIGKQSGIEVKI